MKTSRFRLNNVRASGYLFCSTCWKQAVSLGIMLLDERVPGELQKGHTQGHTNYHLRVGVCNESLGILVQLVLFVQSLNGLGSALHLIPSGLRPSFCLGVELLLQVRLQL